MNVPKSILVTMGALVGGGWMLTGCPTIRYSSQRTPRWRVAPVPAFSPPVARAPAGSALKPLDLQKPPDLIVYDPNVARFFLHHPCGGCGMG